MKKIVLGVLGGVALILICCASYWYIDSTKETLNEQSLNTAETLNTQAQSFEESLSEELRDVEKNEQIRLAPSHVPEGWNVYTTSSSTWSTTDRKIAFAYPSSWVLEEKYVTVFEGQPREHVRLDMVLLSGDGYEIEIHQKGRGASPNWTTRNVGGYDARMWNYTTEAERGLKYGTTLGIIKAGFIITVSTTDETKQIFDQFVSTVKFN